MNQIKCLCLWSTFALIFGSAPVYSAITIENPATGSGVTYHGCAGVPISFTVNYQCYGTIPPTLEWIAEGDISGNGTVIPLAKNTQGKWVGTWTPQINGSFWVTANGSGNCSSSSDSIRVKIIGVASLTMHPADAMLIDSTDFTRTYVMCQAASGSATVTATAYPAAAEIEIPPCWTTTSPSGTGTAKLTRTVSKSTAGTTVITASAGGVTRTATVHVLEVASVAVTGGATEIDDGDGDPNTKTFLISSKGTGDVAITATPNPGLTETQLGTITCWETTGGIGTAKLVRTVSKATCGTNTVSFVAGSSYKKVTIIVFADVASVSASEGIEVDDGDSNPNTKQYVVYIAGSGSVTVTATANPVKTEAELADTCWTTTGGTGSAKLTRTVSKTVRGDTTVTFTCGTSQKSVTVSVIELTSGIQMKRSDEPSEFYAIATGGDVVLDEVFSFRAVTSSYIPHVGDLGNNVIWELWNKVGFNSMLAAGNGPEFNQSLNFLGWTDVVFAWDANHNGIRDSGEPFARQLHEFEVINLITKSLTVACHTNDPLSNAEVDAILAEATEILRKRDILDDLRCGVKLQRSGNVMTFGTTNNAVGTPPSHISSLTDSNLVFSVNADIKVVTEIWDSSVLGEARELNVLNFVVRSDQDGDTWVHEYGHCSGWKEPGGWSHYQTPFYPESMNHRIMWIDSSGAGNTMGDSERLKYRAISSQ